MKPLRESQAGTVFWAIVLPTLVLFVGVLALTTAARLPAEPVEERLKQLQASGAIWQAEYPGIAVAGFKIAAVDAYSECIALSHALSRSALPFAERPAGDSGEGWGACAQLNAALIETNGVISYPRFYHGASAILRVTLQVLDLSTVRLISTLMLLSLMGILTYFAFQQSRSFGFSLGIYFLLLTDFPLQGLSLSHGLSTIVGLAGVVFVIWVQRNFPKYTLGTAASAGVAYALTAHLYTPMVFVVLTGSLLAAMSLGNGVNARSRVAFAAGASISWAIGYGIAIALRFAWSWLVLGSESARSEASTATGTRLTNSLEQFIEFRWMLTGQLTEYGLRTIGSFIVLALLFYTFGTARGWVLGARETWGVITPSVLALLWLVAMAGHNGHGFVFHVVAVIPINLMILAVLNSRVALNTDASPSVPRVGSFRSA